MFTQSYIEQLQKMHNSARRPRGFGGAMKNLGEIEIFLKKWQPHSILDYGCGKGVISAYLRDQYPNTKVDGYDPAVPIYKEAPNKPYDCIVCIDVLEHIEPSYIHEVLEHINTLSNRYIWLRIDTIPARKFLDDGRNAHLLLHDQEWWTELLSRRIEGTIVYNTLTRKGKIDIAIEKTNTG